MSGTAPASLSLARSSGERDWQTIRDDAVRGVARRSGTVWTDHNPSDPGITLLETIAYSIADLHGRAALWAEDLDSWLTQSGRGQAVEERSWLAPPVASDAAGARRVWRCAQALSGGLAPLTWAVDGASSRRDAVVAVIAAAGSVADPGGGVARPLDWDEATIVVARLRQPKMRCVAFDLADELDEFVADLVDAGVPPRSRDAIVAARRRPTFDSLWDEEVMAMCSLARHRRRIADAAELYAHAGSSASTTPPEDAESTTGETLAWPPHPHQVLGCEPVTALDIAGLARTVTGVRRAWVVPVVLRGIDWAGRPVDAVPAGREHLLGASTIVVEAEGPLPIGDGALTVQRFLRRVLYSVINGSAPAAPALDTTHGADTPLERFHAPGGLGPRRVMCEQIGIARLGRTPVTVTASVHIGASAGEDQVLAEIEHRINGYLTVGRRPPAADAGGLRAEGPWPPSPSQPSGWEPGEAIPLTELQRVIHDVPSVLGVSRLGTTPAALVDEQLIPVAAGTVPHLEQLCVEVVVERERGCRER